MIVRRTKNPMPTRGITWPGGSRNTRNDLCTSTRACVRVRACARARVHCVAVRCVMLLRALLHALLHACVAALRCVALCGATCHMNDEVCASLIQCAGFHRQTTTTTRTSMIIARSFRFSARLHARGPGRSDLDEACDSWLPKTATIRPRV